MSFKAMILTDLSSRAFLGSNDEMGSYKSYHLRRSHVFRASLSLVFRISKDQRKSYQLLKLYRLLLPVSFGSDTHLSLFP